MIWLMIVFGLLYIIFSFWNCTTNNKDIRFFTAALLSVSIIMVFSAYLTYQNRNTPTAMDVYQGKTTLEYKVVDDVKADSVVIFKTMQLN